MSGWLARPDAWRVFVVGVMCLGGLLSSQAVVIAQVGEQATLTLTPDRGTCSTEVVAHGDGYIPGSAIEIVAGPWGGDNFLYLAEASVSEAGTFQVDLPLNHMIADCRSLPAYSGEIEFLIVAQTKHTDTNEPYASTVFTFLAGSQHFESTWARSDKPVAEGLVDRTWIWGPEPLTDVIEEPYAESSDGQRIVQYYDKSRMEITDPDADPSSPWYVTNGLLATELITGQMQLGDTAFEQREPAAINVAGDLTDPSGPTYASFAGLLDAEPAEAGDLITSVIERDGSVHEGSMVGVPVTEIDPVTNHSIAAPFWSFLTWGGVIWDDGEYTNGPLFPNPVYATGRPITEPYWAEVLLAGEERDVLIQCFERRCLTYTPDNPDGWKTETGNVGRHYYLWRYGDLPEG